MSKTIAWVGSIANQVTDSMWTFDVCIVVIFTFAADAASTQWLPFRPHRDHQRSSHDIRPRSNSLNTQSSIEPNKIIYKVTTTSRSEPPIYPDTF